MQNDPFPQHCEVGQATKFNGDDYVCVKGDEWESLARTSPLGVSTNAASQTLVSAPMPVSEMMVRVDAPQLEKQATVQALGEIAIAICLMLIFIQLWQLTNALNRK